MTHKNNGRALTKHHRKMKCHLGTDHPSNISLVRRKHHEAYHLLFSNMNTNQIAEELNSKWIDPAYELIVQKRDPIVTTDQSF